MNDKDKKIKQLLEEKSRLLDMLAESKKEKKEITKSPANFVQLSRKAMSDIRNLADKSSLALKVLILLAEKMNKQNALVISQKALCQLMGKGRTAIYTAIKLLEKEQWIKTLKVGTANAYIVNERVFWSTDTQKRKYAVFSASIVTTECEQDMTAEEWDSIETKHFPFLDLKEDRPILTDENLPPPDQKDIDLN